MEKLGRFLLRGLRIGASTIAIIELVRNDWTGGISAALAWLVFLQVERRLPPALRIQLCRQVSALDPDFLEGCKAPNPGALPKPFTSCCVCRYKTKR